MQQMYKGRLFVSQNPLKFGMPIVFVFTAIIFSWIEIERSLTPCHSQAGFEMVTDAVANATKLVWLATRGFQAVTKLVTS